MGMKPDDCPFKVGDTVVYHPSERGLALEVMSSAEGKLIPGEEYLITEIKNCAYVVVQGYRHPGGGLYWTEFQKKKTV
jgi:hypothetical protein